jgi:hypothetical protein
LTITNGLGYHLPARQGLQPVMLSPHHSRAHQHRENRNGGREEMKHIRRRPRKASASPISLSTPGDKGASGPANMDGMIEEERGHIDIETGAVINPNKYRGYRRAPWFERYATKGRLTPDQHAAASRLFQAYEGFPARDPLAAIGGMVDKSNWTNDPLAVKVDQRREFYQMWHSIPTQSRPIVQHVILYDMPIRSVAGCTNSDREERQMQRLREGLNAIP